jgi:hypothetical protein
VKRLRLGRTCLVGAALVLSAWSVASCSDDAAQELSRQQELRQERREGAREERLRQLERELREQKREKRKTQEQALPPAPAPAPSTPAPPSNGTENCGEGLSVGPNTTCAFAASVKDAYLGSGGGSVTVDAYSPVTQRMYSMSCAAGSPTVCRGGNDASVFIH